MISSCGFFAHVDAEGKSAAPPQSAFRITARFFQSFPNLRRVIQINTAPSSPLLQNATGRQKFDNVYAGFQNLSSGSTCRVKPRRWRKAQDPKEIVSSSRTYRQGEASFVIDWLDYLKKGGAAPRWPRWREPTSLKAC